MVAVQRVVEPGDHASGVAKSRMRGDVFDPLAVNPHLSPVVEAVEKFAAGIGEQCRHWVVSLLKRAKDSSCSARFGRDAKIVESSGQRERRRPRVTEEWEWRG
jgi:hypothetical protein